jgi:hypothetical protein
VTTALALKWGRGAVLPGLVFGLVATAIQMIAVERLRRAWGASTAEFLKGFGWGMLLRLLGVVAVGAAVLLDRSLFPPLPTALGFVGVLIPLLWLEARFVR